jgi:hypothetical protein
MLNFIELLRKSRRMRKENNGLPFNVVIPNKTTEKVFRDKRNSGSKFHGSRLPWRDLICILETIALNSTPGFSTQRERKARSGPGVQG